MFTKTTTYSTNINNIHITPINKNLLIPQIFVTIAKTATYFIQPNNLTKCNEIPPIQLIQILTL